MSHLSTLTLNNKLLNIFIFMVLEKFRSTFNSFIITYSWINLLFNICQRSVCSFKNFRISLVFGYYFFYIINKLIVLQQQFAKDFNFYRSDEIYRIYNKFQTRFYYNFRFSFISIIISNSIAYYKWYYDCFPLTYKSPQFC